MKQLICFPKRSEFEKAKGRVEALSLQCEVISPEPAYRAVGVPALVVDSDAWPAIGEGIGKEFVCSGWVNHNGTRNIVPECEPPTFNEDVFGEAAIMVLAPCVADERKIRIIAHISGELSEVFPYLNAEMTEGCYNPDGPTFTFMDGYRMVSLYPRRITIAKADDIVDAWRTLEKVRCRVNRVWERRAHMQPCYQMREKPPALEILKRLPQTNCAECGERTCLAFAVRVRAGEASIQACKPVFQGGSLHLRDALIEICAGLGAMS
jgi:ArsR family metal-binding transcriptional regulator